MSKRLEQGRCKVVATSAFCNGVNVCLFLAFYYTVYTVQLYVQPVPVPVPVPVAPSSYHN